MANTTSDEPKAPIVRIRKKRTKKKKDVVHLPVRASRTARYSSLTTPTNPQSKGRECCRNIFSSCFKIPVCRTLCFRCILPRCYDGEGSDDEADARDEGYHSQNRRSSDITPSPVGGATGGAEIEMTEMKTEAVTLVPPPRHITTNDYKRHPCINGSPKHSSSDTEHEPLKESEVTYIEVENISLSGDPIYIPESNLFSEINEIVNLSGSDTISKENAKATIEGGKSPSCYEDPGNIHVDETPEKLGGDIKTDTAENTASKTVDSSEYVECDREFSDESQFYVNEDVLFRPAVNSGKTVADKNDRAICYANVDADSVPDNSMLHSKTNTDTTKQSPRAKGKKPHEYVNVNSSITNVGDIEESDFVVTGMVKTSSLEFKQLMNKSHVKLPTRISKSVKTSPSHKRIEDTPEYKGDKQSLIKKDSNSENGTTEVVIKSGSETSNGDNANAEPKNTDQTKLL